MNSTEAEKLSRCYRLLFQMDCREDLDFHPAYLSTMGRMDLEIEIARIEERQ